VCVCVCACVFAFVFVCVCVCVCALHTYRAITAIRTLPLQYPWKCAVPCVWMIVVTHVNEANPIVVTHVNEASLYKMHLRMCHDMFMNDLCHSYE